MSADISKDLLRDVLIFAVSSAQVALEKDEDGAPISAMTHAEEISDGMSALLRHGVSSFVSRYDQSVTVSEQSFTDMIRFIRDASEDATDNINSLKEIIRLGQMFGVARATSYTNSVWLLRTELRKLAKI